MATKLMLSVFVVLAVSLVLRSVETRPSEQDILEMAETIRTLENLERFYSQLARPRYGRSVDKVLTEEEKEQHNKGGHHEVEKEQVKGQSPSPARRPITKALLGDKIRTMTGIMGPLRSHK